MCCRASASVSVECAGQADDANHRRSRFSLFRHSAVRKDDDLVALIGEGVARGGIVHVQRRLRADAEDRIQGEGRMVDLATVEPRPKAIELAGKVHKDPALR